MQPPRLPAHLQERLRLLNQQPINERGEFLLCWLHHAVRDHDNPVLDAAIAAANDLGLPVLVYQGLGGNHRFNADRHHTFIMEGARDLAAGLARRGIAYGFYLGADPTQPTPLKRLAQRAALVVMEDYPAPPFPRWSRRLADIVKVAAWAVDGHCIVPMQWVGKPIDRAFKFRQRTATEFEQRLLIPWRDALPEQPPFTGDWGFERVDLERADLAELCASCAIDHAVAPVFHTPGGSAAGYRRWEAFKAQGLKGYAKRRNDAASDGVSRLSPYLHHGHVSPFRIAREAQEVGGSGAEKFLDELLIWRELAYNFCFHRRELESLQTLPKWAQETLSQHQSDPRSYLYSWEQLARGQTHSRLWNAAQKSLLIHGELHNNVRMTWGKALLEWTKSPQQALDFLIDLNHRYALDGNDPNSYGGLLWCMGGLDRPFTPEQPVLGTVRPRSPEQHAERLDLAAYEARFTRRSRRHGLRVAVVGAGLAGLMAARTLQDHALEVVVFDKGRGVGGRLSTRRGEGIAFDHGAQYFTARDPRFSRYVAAWEQAGVVAPWMGRWARLKGGKVIPSPDDQRRYVGVPGMNAVAKHLAQALAVYSGVRITELRPSAGGWLLAAQTEGEGEALPDALASPFDAVIIAIPPAQASLLLAPHAPHLAKAADGVVMQPCWTVMASFATPLALAFDGGFCQDQRLSWIARNSSKPERPRQEAWVLHATPEWSKAHRDAPKEAVAEALLTAFFELSGSEPQPPVLSQSHSWLYAMAPTPLSVGALWDGEQRLGACGDWCAGQRVEGAFLSGMAMAGRLLNLADRSYAGAFQAQRQAN